MSFQYINQYNLNNFNRYQIPQYAQQPNIAQHNFAFMPIQTSMYNQGVIYPYSPLFIPNTNQDYASLGTIKSMNGEDVHLFRLKNGQKVAIMPRKNESTIVKTFLNSGSINENDRTRGIMHVIEHCVFKGSSKLQDGDVFKLTGLMGANTNASTDYANVDYYISAPELNEENLKKAIEIQADMITRPTFDSKAIESEKEPICSEISMINDEPTSVAFDKVIRNLFQINSNSQNLVAGSIDTVKNLSQNDIVNQHKSCYDPENIYTVIVGDVDVNKTIDLVSKNFTLPQKSIHDAQPTHEILNPIRQAKREDIRSSKTNNTTVFLGFEGPKAKDGKDLIIERMINYYLAECSTSDLKNNLEKINAAYDSSVQKVGTGTNHPRALISIMELNPNDEQRGLDIFYDAIQKLQNQPLSDADMQAIKKNTLKSVEYGTCDSEILCDMLGNNLIDNTLYTFSNYKEIANSITKEDIMNFAKKYYDLSKVSIVAVHPSRVSEQDIQSNYQASKYSYANVKQNANTLTFKGNKKVSTKNVKESKLPNNTHLAFNSTDQNLCVYNWTVNTPPIKPKNPNIPAVLRYMFEKGSEYKNQSELERFKELNGIDVGVYVNGKSIEISADCLPQDNEKTLELMNELLYHPKLTQNDFEEAKKYVKDMLETSQKDATSNLLDKLYPGYFPTDSAMLKAIDKLTLDDVKEFYKELLSNASSSFIATIPNKKYPMLEQQVINYQNSNKIKFKENIPKLTPLFEANPTSNVIYDTDDLNQAQIYKSYKFPLSGNIEDEAKFELVNAILGASPNARLFSDLRDKQHLAYSVSSRIQSFENTGIVTLMIQTTTDNKEANIKSYDNVEKSLEGFKKHTELLCKELVSDEELEAAKNRLKQNIIGQCQNPLSETSLLAMNILEPYGIKRIDKYIEAVDKVTKEDIMQAANFIFSHNPTISILASEDTINSQMKYLEKQGELQKAEN